ncbi:hypothetical protein [Corynebacterium cystitidis]|uniref:hypothetical protein n=1 Tax=Corynebacterium cystitidis TaxID=35757 RepID=UPI00211F1A04|nr:hypothetical protein [Corynebacterium cystitidis]
MSIKRRRFMQAGAFSVAVAAAGSLLPELAMAKTATEKKITDKTSVPWYAEERTSAEVIRPGAGTLPMSAGNTVDEPESDLNVLLETKSGVQIQASATALSDSTFSLSYTEILRDGEPGRVEHQLWSFSPGSDLIVRDDVPRANSIPRCPRGTYPKRICTAISKQRALACCGSWALTPLGFAGCGKGASIWYNAGCIAAFIVICATCQEYACVRHTYICAQ